MIKNIIYTLAFFFCSQLAVTGQHVNKKRPGEYFKIAEKEFHDQRYTYAIPFYRSSLQSGRTNDSLALLHLAECYWRIKNYDSALVYYKEYEKRATPLYTSNQRIAELKASQGQYSQAAITYKRLLDDTPLRNGKMLAERWKGFSDITPFVRDSLDFSIHLLKLNSKQQDFSPQFFRQGMVFVSNRYAKRVAEREFGWDGLPYANIYWVKDTTDLYIIDSMPERSHYTLNASINANDDYTNRTSNDNDIINVSSMRGAYSGDIHRLAKFSDDLNTKFNYGPLCFSKSGTTVYFTRNSKKPVERRYNLEICEATMENSVWGKIRIMPFVKPAYDFYHPALSDDGQRLYFCSNQPDGFGGSDIYYVNLSGETEKAVAINMGETVNTSGDELFPTINGEMLCYSSDGLAGLGGLDLYKTTVDNRGNWQKPVNFGYPLNSSFDDFGIICNTEKNKGFFSSNRLGTDDIYTFTNAPFLIQMTGTVFNRVNMRRLDKAKVMITSIEAGKPSVDSFTTDLTGNFRFPIRPAREYQLSFSRNGFIEESIIIQPASSRKDLVLETVRLTPIVQASVPPVEKDRDGDGIFDSKDKCPDIKGTRQNDGCPDIQKRLNELAKMVFFDRDKDNILPKSLQPLNDIVDVLRQYPNTTLLIEGHTDSKLSAAHNMDLSKRRSNSVKTFFVNKGLNASRFQTRGYGLERPVADNNTAEGRALNRRVEMKATFIY